MIINVNGRECKSTADIMAALQWEVQQPVSGAYATISYPVGALWSSYAWRHNLPADRCWYNGNTFDIMPQWTFDNWYRDEPECTIPSEDGGRAYSAELSYQYCAKQIINYIERDLSAFGVELG